MNLERVIDVASGRTPADLLLRGGKIVNVLSHEIYEADLAIAEGRIAGLGTYKANKTVDLKGQYICPGFIDSHVHIESSMLSVPEFAKIVSACGTTAVITDPHEIANVLGAEGIRFILSSSKYCPIHVYAMLSSCVPASHLESSGAELTAIDLLPLLSDEWVLGLAEMMNFPGVIANHPDTVDKLRIAGNANIDGHAPGLTGQDLVTYAASGVQTDHECTTIEEAQEKLRLGMMIMIREGSAAKNLDALAPMITRETSDRFMFCTDDKDVADLTRKGHIDCMVRRSIELGVEPTIAVRVASYNVARHFGLRRVGAICPGFHASLCVLDNLSDCRATQVYQAGELVAEDGQCIYVSPPKQHKPILRSTMNVPWLEKEHFLVDAGENSKPKVRVIDIVEDQLHTGHSIETMPVRQGNVVADPARDIAKLAVIERHQASGNIGLGFVRGLGLADGAIASTIAHDAHNLIVAGTNDRDIYTAAVHIVKLRGGLCVAQGGEILADCPLPIAGLMSEQPASELCDQLDKIHSILAKIGCKVRNPFNTMSFMSLSVIGKLKLTDRGLVDVDRFEIVDLLVD